MNEKTTDDMRCAVMHGTKDPHAAALEFDRWLAQHDAEVRANALSLDELDTLVTHLWGTRDGLILADALNKRFGRSARRRIAREIGEQ